MKFLKFTIYASIFLLTLGFVQDASAAVTLRPALNLGLVGYWSMDEGTGTQAGDMSGNGNDGSILSQVAGDDFNRANASPINGSWAKIPAMTNSLKVVSNQAAGIGATADNAAYQTGTYAADQYAQVKVNAFATSFVSIFLRVDTSTSDAYWVQFQAGSIQFGKNTGATGTVFQTYNGSYVNDGDTIRAAVIGNSLYAYVNGSLLFTYNDTSAFRSSGQPGLYIRRTITYADDWEAGNVSNTWVDGKRGKALSFDGASNYVNAGSASSLDNINVITTAAWVKIGSGAFRGAIAEKMNWRGGNGGWWLLADTTSGQNRFEFSATFSTANGTWKTDTDTIAAGNWYYVVVTYDHTSTTNNPLIYINGQSVTVTETSTPSGTVPSDATASFYMGGASASPSFDFFNGTIDEVRVYNRALAPSEVEGLYETGAAKILAPNNLGLVGSWSFEEGTGTQAGDSSGNGNTGTLTNSPTWTDGKRGKALSFDGTDDYVNIPNSDSLSFGSGNFSLSAWFKSDQTSGQVGWIVGKYGPSDEVYGIELSRSTGTLAGQIQDSGFDKINPVTTQSYNDNLWHHVVLVRNGSTASLYVDGVFNDSDTNAAVGSVTSSAPLGIGTLGAAGGPVEFLRGVVDEVRVYNRVLTPSEVADLYASSGKITTINSSQNSRLTSGLIGLWSFNGPDVSGATAYDRAGTNNGTITGATPAIGKVGQALTFDGTDDNVNLGNPSVLNLNTNFTISAWVKVNNFGVTNILQGIVAKGDAVVPTDTIGIRADGSGSGNCSTGKCLTFRLNDGTNNAEGSYDAVTGTWYHVVMVVGARGVGGLRGFIDGVERVTENTSTVGDVTTTNNWYVGDNERNDSYFNGVIDEVRIYNRALSASEIQQLYTMGGGEVASTPAWACGDALADSRDSKTYATVSIGSQCWMKQNMNIGTRVNGGTAQGTTCTNAADIEKWCYSDTATNCDTNNNPNYPDGGLYQWNQAMCGSTTAGVQGICLSGWHLPTDAEYCTLEQTVDSSITCASTGFRGTDGGTKLKPNGTSGWEGNLAGYNFSGFSSRATYGYFWSSSEVDATYAWYRYLNSGSAQVGRNSSSGGYSKTHSFSLRCVKD